MKIGITQTMIAFVICGVSMAHDNHAQILDKEVTIHASEVPLENVLTEIADQTQVKFAYGIDHLDLKEKVSVSADKRSLGSILNELLSPLNIRYKVHDKTITLRKQDNDNDDDHSYLSPSKGSDKKSALLPVTGRVTTSLGDPMAGVNIIVKGTTNGTTSDADGRYSINVEMNQVLALSFIGYKTVEIVFNGQANIDVTMSEDVANLGEVTVNAGYYKTSKEFQTGSIVKVEAKDIEKQPLSNPIAALQGRVAGLEIIQQNGVPGGNFKVRIRGINSLSSGNDPLYIIDGVPYTSTPMTFSETAGNILGGSTGSNGNSPLNSINPSDIESIEILKDADATAIYGSRGANGVILITTKKGEQGKTNVGVNFYSGVAKVSRSVNVLQTPDYLTMRKEAFLNDEVTPNDSNAPDLMVWDTTRNTNWQKELIGDAAHITDVNLSISGGDSNTQFLLSGGFHKETTVFPGLNYDQRLSALASIANTSPNGKLKTSFSVNVARTYSNLPGKDLTYSALTLAPNAPEVHDGNGDLNWEGWTSSVENPLAFLKRKYEANGSNLITNATIGYKVISHLEAKVSLGYTNIESDAITTYPKSSYNPNGLVPPNISVFGNSSFHNWIAEPQLNWSSPLATGTIDVLAGATFMSQNRKGLSQYAEGFSSESLMQNLAAASTVTSATNYYADYRYQAFFGRINYTLSGKYVVNVTARRDGSSRFGPGNQFSVFSAVGAAWIFSKEAFASKVMPFLSFGKIRASYGTTGNDQIGDYQYLDSYSSVGLYQGQQGLGPTRLYNPDFAWEENRKLEANIELGFLNDRITFNFNYYHNRSSSQLVGIPLGATTGFSSIQGNFPATIQNTGAEFEVSSINMQSEDGFEWFTSVNLTVPRNKLIKFPNIEAFPAYSTQYEVGEPLEIAKLYEYAGVNPSTGIYDFKDMNEDGTIDVNDRTATRFLGRKFYGGISNTIKFKGFQLDFLFQFVNQQGYNHTHSFGMSPGALFNQPELVMGRWTSPGQEGKDVQRFTVGGTATSNAYMSYLYYSTAAVTDASFIRLKNLSFSYSLRNSLLNKMRLQDLTVFVQGQNLLTFTKYKGLDPETSGSSSLPPLRTLTAGVKFKI